MNIQMKKNWKANGTTFVSGKSYSVDDETAQTWVEAGLAAASNLDDLVQGLQETLGSDEPADGAEDTESEEMDSAKILHAVERAIVAKTNKVDRPFSINVKEEKKSLGEYLQLVGKTAANQSYEVRRKAYSTLQKKYSQKANTEGSAGAGGDLVPYDFIPELLFVEGYDPLWRRSRIINTNSNVLKIPSLDQTVTPSGGFNTAFAGGVVVNVGSEATPPSQTNPQFLQLSGTMLKHIAYTQVSNELLSDSPISLEQIVSQQFATALNSSIDNHVLNGAAGGTQYQGIIGYAATIVVPRETASQFQLQDAANMYAKLAPASRTKAVWVMSPTVIGQLVQLKDSSGRAVFLVNLTASGALDMRLFGLPIIVSEHSPVIGGEGDVLLADMSNYVLGLRADMSIQASTEFAFTSDIVTYRITFRAYGLPQLTQPIKLAANSSYTVSPFVALSDQTS